MEDKFNADDLSKLINDVSESSKQLLVAKEAEREAQKLVTKAVNHAEKSWDAVYEYLKQLADVHKNDWAFKNSKLGKLLIPQAVSWNSDKEVITEQTD